MQIVTISRQMGSLGDEIAEIAARNLGFDIMDRAAIGHLFVEHGISPDDAAKVIDQLPRPGKNDRYDPRACVELIHNDIMDLAEKKDLVVVGQAGFVIFQEHEPSLHVRVIAGWKTRIRRTMKRYQLTRDQAVRKLQKSDRERKRYMRELFNFDWTDPVNYDLLLNTDRMTPEGAAGAVVETAKRLGIGVRPATGAERLETRPVMEPAPAALENPAAGRRPSEFVNESEAEFARLLDFYQLRWEYEPKTFPLEWDENGKITAAFTPDFYLADYDLFIELTTLKQKLVTFKNRKIKKLKELHPDVKIKLFYGRDYQYLFSKYMKE